VQHQIQGKIYVKKTLLNGDRNVLELIKNNPHKNVCEIVDIFDSAQNTIIIEDYINGQTLEELITEKGVLTEKEAVPIITAICSGLSHLHSLTPPVIHRDLKPSNIMITTDGTVKIIDFNASRLYKANVAQDTVILGTAGYASPEQFGFRETDVRSDVYSLGILMNYLLTGKHPAEKPYDGKLKRVIDKATNLAPEKRFSNVGKLMTAIHPLFSVDKPKSRFSLPVPGFRSGTIWKMILACVGYFIIFSTVFSGKTQYENPAIIIADRAFFLAMCLFLVALFTNCLHFRDRLPFFGSKKLPIRIGGYVLFSSAIIFVCAGLFTIVKSIILSV
jgi:serine/threonine protein kinase